jgi:hypothetical protein
MRKLIQVAFCAVGTGLLLTAFTPQVDQSPSSEYPTPAVREEQQVVVNGITETWQLKWLSPPKPVCEPNEISLTFPCTGFAYGEGGDLVLTRSAFGTEIDRLAVTPFFQETFGGTGIVAIIQRWQADYDADSELSSTDDFPSVVANRPVVRVMHFADYDHDGQQTEFYLHTETAPSTKNIGVVIGLSRKNPRLHAFGTASNPTEPLYMLKENWEALRDATGPIEDPFWTCDDHGADTETTLRLGWTENGIEGTRREFSCPPGDKRLLEEQPL